MLKQSAAKLFTALGYRISRIQQASELQLPDDFEEEAKFIIRRGMTFPATLSSAASSAAAA